MARGIPNTPEAEERQRAHLFGIGQDPRNVNRITMREFYRWVESEATIEDLKAYVKDKSKPVVRQRFVKAFLDCATIDNFFALTNQTHGYPKQEVAKIDDIRVSIIFDGEVEQPNDNGTDNTTTDNE